MKKRRFMAFILAVLVVGGFSLISEFRVKKELNETRVYFANQEIPDHTQITDDMVGSMALPKKGLPPGILYDKSQIVGKYTQAGYGLAANSFFFQNKIVTEDELMDAARMKLKPGQTLFTGDVNLLEAAAGNVLPGTKVDIWFQAVESQEDPATGNVTQKWVTGPLYYGVDVISAKNKKAEDIVQKNTTSTVNAQGKTTTPKKELYPTVVQLGVSQEQFKYLTAATSSAFTDGTLILVPQGISVETLPDLNETSTMDIKDYIKSKQYNFNQTVDVKGAEQ